jgi:hypothetical protein
VQGKSQSYGPPWTVTGISLPFTLDLTLREKSLDKILYEADISFMS